MSAISPNRMPPSRSADRRSLLPSIPLSAAPRRAGAKALPLALPLAFGLALLMALLPVLLTSNPPLFDYPNHLARVDAILRLGADPWLLANFTLSSFLLPNALSDIVLLGLMQVTEPRVAGRILLGSTMILTFGGLAVLTRLASGRFSPWTLLASLFLINEMTVWGFLNYNFGLALLPWALALWLALDKAPSPVRIAAGTMAGFLIFLAHLVAFGLYAVAIAMFELVRAARHRRDPPGRVLGRLAGSAMQFVPILLVHAAISPANGLPLDLRFDFSAWGKFAPFSRLLATSNPGMDTAVLVGATLILLLGLLSGRARIEPRLGLAAFAFVLLVWTLPYAAMGSFFLDSRIAIASAFLLVAALAPARLGPKSGSALALAVLTLLGWRTTVLTLDWQRQGATIETASAAFATLPEGALVVPASGRPFELGDYRATRTITPPHEHTAAFAMIDRHAITPNLYAKRGQNPLVFAPEMEILRRLDANPIRRVVEPGALDTFATDLGAAAMANAGARTPFSGLYAVAFYRTCEEWPKTPEIEPIACGADFSLVKIEAPTSRSRTVAGAAQP